MKMYIDYVQSLKSSMTDRVIKDKQLNDAAHNFIKAQTQFAHMVVENTETMMKYVFDMVTKGCVGVKKNEQ